jgi:elongation factor Ts
MSNIELIKAIRYKTGLAIKDINKAIDTLNTNNEDEIIKYLREQGVIKQQTKEGRETSNGKIFTYVHEGRIGVMLEIKSETDFVSRSPEFQEVGDNLVLHLAAYQPKFISDAQIDQKWIEEELAIAKEQLLKEGKPEAMIDGILNGKKDKIAKEVCLLTQPFIKNPDISVGEYIAQYGATTGEKVEVTRFVIYNLNS